MYSEYRDFSCFKGLIESKQNQEEFEQGMLIAENTSQSLMNKKGQDTSDQFRVQENHRFVKGEKVQDKSDQF